MPLPRRQNQQRQPKSPQPRFNEEQLYTLIEINKAIVELEQSDNFQHYKKAIEAKMQESIPNVSLYGFNQEKSLEYSMQLAYFKGLSDALAQIENSKKKMADCQKALKDLQNRKK